MTIQKTFLAIKPNAYKRGQSVAVIEMLSKLLPDCRCIAMRSYTPTDALAREHYAALSDKPFFPELIESFTAGPILGMVWEGENIVARAREAMGATDPSKATEGTIRNKFGTSINDNIIHGSDTEPGSAEREVAIHFSGAAWTLISDPVLEAKKLTVLVNN